MALGLSFSVVQSRTGKILTFTDTTGVYSVDNVTGYGTPNPDRSDVIRTEIRVRNPKAVNDYVKVFNTGSFIPKDNLSINLVSEDLDLPDNSVYPDGVSLWNYGVFFETCTGHFTPNSNQVELEGSSAVDVYNFYTSKNVAGKTYISKGGNLYLVTNAVSAGGNYYLYLEKNWTGELTHDDIYIGFNEAKYLLTYWTSKKYVIDLIADIESTSCCSDCGSEEAWKSYSDLQSALALYSCGKYADSQEVLDFIVKKTQSSSCTSCG